MEKRTCWPSHVICTAWAKLSSKSKMNVRKPILFAFHNIALEFDRCSGRYDDDDETTTDDDVA
jgi:hypothetical protein